MGNSILSLVLALVFCSNAYTNICIGKSKLSKLNLAGAVIAFIYAMTNLALII